MYSKPIRSSTSILQKNIGPEWIGKKYTANVFPRALLKNQNFEIWQYWNLFNFSHWFFGIQYLVFWEKRIDSGPGPIFYTYVQEYFSAELLLKICLYDHEKLQRNPSLRSCLNFFIFLTLWIWLSWILTNARRGVMRSKTQWVLYSDLDWWPGPQKVQCREITGYP